MTAPTPREQPATDVDVPDAPCPRCGEWVPDHDGFGVLAHVGPTYEHPCGYCSHPSRDGGACGICGDRRWGGP